MSEKKAIHIDEKKDVLCVEKQKRREFLRTLGKAALPAVTLLGLATLNSSLYGNQKNEKADNLSPVPNNCEGGCEGGCTGGCEGGCSSGCSGCEGTCDGTCSGDCSGTCTGDSSGLCTDNWNSGSY